MGQIIGLDVGNDSLKASVFEGSLGRYNFSRHITIEYSDTQTSLREKQDEAIHSLMSQQTKECRFFFAYPADFLSSKKIALPFEDQSKVEQVLPFYIEDQIPFEIDDVQVVHRVLQVEENKTDLFISVIPKTKLKEFLHVYQEKNIDPEFLPVDADLLSNATTLPYEVVIDIGYSRTLCVVCLEGKAIQIRSLSKGTKDIEIELKKHFPNDDAKKFLSKVYLSSPNIMVEDDDEQESADAIIVRNMHRIITAIRQILINVEDSLEIEVPSVQVCGGASSIKGITDFFAEELGVPVKIMDIPQNPKGASHALSYWIGQCATGNSHGREFNLRAGEFSYKGNLALLGSIIRITMIASVVLLVGGFSWFGFQYYKLNEELATKDTEIVSLFSTILPEAPEPADRSMALLLVETEIENAKEQIDTFEKLFPPEPPILSMLKAFSSNLPPHAQARIDVSEITFSKNSINIKAETNQFEDATNIVQSLQKYPLFAQAQKSDEKTIAKGVRFNIVIPLVQESTEEE